MSDTSKRVKLAARHRPFDGWWGRMLLLVWLGSILVEGCSSPGKPTSARFGSVDIQGNTPGQIHNMALVVFKNHGYKLANDKLTTFNFEKEGTRWDEAAYGSWIGDAPVWIRVKLTVALVGEGICRLQCNVVVVRDRGGSLEEEIPARGFKSRPYQELLDEVAARLQGKVPEK